MDLEQIIVVARYVVTLGYLRNILDHTYKLGGNIAIEPTEFYAAKNDKTPVQLVGVEYRDIFFYIPFAFQTLETLEDGGGGQMHAGRQFLGGKTGVLLQQAENLQVDLVERIPGNRSFFCRKSFFTFHSFYFFQHNIRK